MALEKPDFTCTGGVNAFRRVAAREGVGFQTSCGGGGCRKWMLVAEIGAGVWRPETSMAGENVWRRSRRWQSLPETMAEKRAVACFYCFSIFDVFSFLVVSLASLC
ncbi:hypothetical protein Salat_1883700 [Sesamum alatum]|uniref:Uncharacterized protein n=1 Tax=Sesamum alatum TaxID=300844 RepID=A0AAE1Y3C3_9LAMI|nr:hypothetical protein Salat_1883700 [Sesamum alatum]